MGSSFFFFQNETVSSAGNLVSFMAGNYEPLIVRSTSEFLTEALSAMLGSKRH